MNNATLLLTRLCLLPKQLLFVTAVICTTGSFTQTIIKVTDGNLKGWVKAPGPATILAFTDGPANPPLGKGSVEYFSPNLTFSRFRNTAYSNVLLSSLTAFGYSTFIQYRQNNTDDISIVLVVDNDGDGKPDAHLNFEPRFQTGKWVKGIAPDQGLTLPGIWQTWDMFHAVWWDFGKKGMPGLPNPENGGEYFSLAAYIGRHPNARFLKEENAGRFGVLRLFIGCPSADYCGGRFKGNADAFTIGINGKTTVYDFELSTDTGKH